MQQPPEQFIEWYKSLKVIKANKGPANGRMATALVVLNRLMTDYDFYFNTYITQGGMQIRGQAKKN